MLQGIESPYTTIKVDEHLTLRQLQAQEAAELFAVVDRNRPRLEKWLPWIDDERTAEDSKKFIEKVIDEWDKAPFYGYGMIYDGKIAGHISLMRIEDDPLPQIGYWLDSSIEGKGLTTKCVKLLTRLGLEILGMEKILIKAKPENHASNRVAEKCGYKLEGPREYPGRGTLNVWMITAK